LPSYRQPESAVPLDSGIKPSAGIAEAFTNVLFPTPSSSGKRIFTDTRRFADLAARSRTELGFEQPGITATQTIGKAGPNEMKEFVNQDKPEEGWVGKEFPFENHSSLANETRGVNGSSELRMRRQQFAPVFGELRLEGDRYGATLHGR
jgi:hypothetical protein